MKSGQLLCRQQVRSQYQGSLSEIIRIDKYMQGVVPKVHVLDCFKECLIKARVMVFRQAAALPYLGAQFPQHNARGKQQKVRCLAVILAILTLAQVPAFGTLRLALELQPPVQHCICRV